MLNEFLDALIGDVSVFFFSTAETDLDFDLISIFEKAFCLAFANVEIMRTHFDGESDTLCIHFLGVRFLNTELFFFLVFKLAKVQEFTDGGFGFGEDLDEVVSAFPGKRNGFWDVEDADYGSLFVDYSYFRCNDLLVDAIDGPFRLLIILAAAAAMMNTHWEFGGDGGYRTPVRAGNSDPSFTSLVNPEMF